MIPSASPSKDRIRRWQRAGGATASTSSRATWKRPLRASAISHAHNVTPRFQKPNVQNKRIYVPELKRWVRLKVSTRALRSINRVGLLSYLRAEGKTLADVT